MTGMHCARDLSVAFVFAGLILGMSAGVVLADNPHHTGQPFPGPAAPAAPPPAGDAPPPPAPPEPPPAEPPCSVGDPVYPYRGDFAYSREEIVIPGKGMPVAVTLRYWSQREYNNRYGYNWFMCYHVRLVALADNSIEVLYGCGGRYNYIYDTQIDAYIPPPGTYAELVALGGGGYSLTQTDGTVYAFDDDGKLTSITDRNGHDITFDYATGGALPIVGKTEYVTGAPSAQTLAYDWKLTTITDTKGDDLTLEYNTNGRLETITDYTGREWSYTFDADDDLTSITTPAIAGFAGGLVTEFDYDDAHHLLTVTDPENRVRVTNTYLANGRLSTQTYGTGTMTLTYDDPNRTTTVVNGENHTTKWAFNADALLTSRKEYTAGLRPGEPAYFETTYSYTANNEFAGVTYPRDNSVEYSYDSRGNVTEVRRKAIGVSGDDPTDIVTSATFEVSSDRVESFTDAESNVTSFEYDTAGNLTEITYPTVGGQTPVVTITYTADGRIELVTDANGNELKYDYYGSTGYIHKIRLDPDGINATYELTHDDVGNIESIKDARNKTTTFAYNAMNWLTTETNPLGYQTKYTYDGNGNVKKVERQSNTGGTTWQTTEFTYTTTGLLKTITNPLGKVTTYNYDDNDNLSSVVDAESNATSYTYDERDLLWKITDALGKLTEYGYDPNANLKTMEDANGNVTTHGLDDFDRLIRLTYDDASYERVALDKIGSVDSLLVNTNVQALYTWDALGRLTQIVYPGGDTVTYAYNVGSQLVEAANGASTLTYVYDSIGRVDTVTTLADGHTHVVAYDHDKNSNRTKLTYPSGYSVDYTYTDNNLTNEIQRNGGALVNYDYDTLDRRVFREIPSQVRFVQTFYEYDGADRVTRVLNKTLRPSPGEDQPEFEWSMRGMLRQLRDWVAQPAWAGTGITISDFTYTYNDVGIRLTMSVDGGTHTYGYDDLYQLTSVSGAQTHSFAYDDVGNRVEVNGVDYASNNLNQYAEVNGVDFDYDDRGNLIDDGVNTYAYDNENRLESVTAGATAVTYAYDAFGRRQMMSVNGTETYFVYDGDHLLAEYDGSGAMKREYVYGAALDEVVSLLKTGPNARYFYYQDGLGSISEIVDANGVLAEQYDYEPYGKTTIKNRTGTVLSTSAMGNRFAFTGRWLDYETNVYDYRARSYFTKLGRFVQRDPLGAADGANLYTYVHNDPINLVDPYGEFAFLLPWIVVTSPGWGPPVITGVAYLGSAVATAWGLSNVLSLSREEGCGAKSREEYDKHIEKRKQAEELLRRLEDALRRARTHKERVELEKAIEKLRRQIMGHEKEIKQKWREGPPKP